MRIVHLSKTDVRGGAARAAYRLHEGLRRLGVDSHVVVQEKLSSDGSVHRPTRLLERLWAKVAARVDAAVVRRAPSVPWQLFSPSWFYAEPVGRTRALAPDIVNLHWVTEGLLRPESLRKFGCPIVWTLHDMWPFTGGCHYAGQCRRYSGTCGECPQLGSTRPYDLSRRVWRRKARAWQSVPLTIVAPSRWMAACALASSLLKEREVHVIPNGLDTDVFKPLDRITARMAFNLPIKAKIVLFGAVSGTDVPRKGFHLLEEALAGLAGDAELRRTITLAIFGTAAKGVGQVAGFNAFSLGSLQDDQSLALLYSAADMLAVPSREDNLPNTILEALACGTPCIAFNIGGLPDMIRHRVNGYLASPFDAADLGRGIRWVLDSGSGAAALRDCARQGMVAGFSLDLQAKSYASLYSSLRTQADS